MFPSQSNTQPGDRPFIAGANLTGFEGRLVKLISNSGTPNVILPAANADITPYVLVDDAIQGGFATVKPLDPDKQVRITAKGTGTAGTILVQADPTLNSGADAGKVRALPTTPGVYVKVGEAEEDFVDGQLVLVRPSLGLMIAPFALTTAAPATTAPALSEYGFTQAQAAALLQSVIDLRAALIAAGLITSTFGG
jgi:hypothetical protein